MLIRLISSILSRNTISARQCVRYFVSTKTLRIPLPPASTILPQFNFPNATNHVRDVNDNLENYLEKSKSITLHGHINRVPRIRSKISFAELRDSNGDMVQLIMLPGRTPSHAFDTIKSVTTEDSICVSGSVQLKKLVPGEPRKWELLVSELQLLNHSHEEAARLDKLKHGDPSKLPPHYRFLQLRTHMYQRNLKLRSKVAASVRQVLGEKHDFTEIETPMLFKSTPEGAREFLVPTRSPKKFYALPQSPQQYKQILMSSGFTRYYQLAKCFRDEDLRSDRQPEFTQVDLEMSFISSTDQVLRVVEDIILGIFTNISPKSLYTLNADGLLMAVPHDHTYPNMAKLLYEDALKNYGIDKPDLRSSLKFVDLSSHFVNGDGTGEFDIIEACVLKKAFENGELSSIPEVIKNPENYTRRAPTVIAIDASNTSTWFQSLVDNKKLRLKETFDEEWLHKTLNLEEGDIIAVSNRSEHPYENPTPLGRFRQLAMKEYPDKWKRMVVEKSGTLKKQPDDIYVSCWVNDFPLFSPEEENSGSNDEYPSYNWSHRESTHHPFTMAKPDDYFLLQSDPYKVHGEHYDLVINGVEVGGGSRRIHNPEVQRFIFEEVLKIENYEMLFGHLLEALSFGCPPHAGLALGFDRLCAMLVKSESIRDVIAFPKNQSGVDPVVESPSSVESDILAKYYIKTQL